MGSFDLRAFDHAEDLAHAAATDCAKEFAQASSNVAAFGLALSGGRIAKSFCSELAEEIRARRLTISQVHFFWSDERCVPPSDPESNFHLANEQLLAPLKLNKSQIHRLEGEKPPDQAVAEATAELLRLAPLNRQRQPSLDLVLLGMGEDGHVASLFPGEPDAIMTDPAVYRCVSAVKPPPLRLTLGYPAIAAATQVWVLASGAGKTEALRQSLAPGGATPLARVLALREHTRIYTDIVLSAEARSR